MKQQELDELISKKSKYSTKLNNIEKKLDYSIFPPSQNLLTFKKSEAENNLNKNN
jgi:hypothetical protein